MQLVLKTKQLPTSSWQTVLLEVLDTLRSLLCTSTYATPHKRFLSFPRRSMIGKSLPCGLIQPGPVLPGCFVRNKNQPLVDEVELTGANSNFAHICFRDGRESTVSVTDLAPCPSETTTFSKSYHDKITDVEQPSTTSDNSPLHNCQRHEPISSDAVDNSLPTVTTCPGHSTRPNSSDSLLSQPVVLRRFSRNIRPPNRFGNNIYNVKQ